MVDLAQCSQCKSPAVEQIRGKMGPGDYKEIQKADLKGHWHDDPDYYLEVYMHDDIKDDFRVSCSKCDNATPWNKQDAPGMPGVGADFTRRVWNEQNTAK